jgi:hypothetical protein
LSTKKTGKKLFLNILYALTIRPKKPLGSKNFLQLFSKNNTIFKPVCPAKSAFHTHSMSPRIAGDNNTFCDQGKEAGK